MIRQSSTRVLAVVCAVAALVAACTGVPPTPAPMTTQPPTAIPATATLPATVTPLPQPTTPPPSPTPAPSPTPLVPWGGGLQLISKSNAASLKEVAQLKGIFGTDGIQWAWPPDHSPLLAVQTWPGEKLTQQVEDWALYDLGTLKPTVEISVTHAPVRNLNYGIAISPDGRYVAVSGRFEAFKLYDSSGRLVRAFQGHTGRTRYVSFSPDSKQIASTSEDGTLRLWETMSGQVARVIQAKNRRGYAQVFFSADGRRLAALGDNVLYIWSAQNGTLLHEMPSQAAAFSPDGKRLASVGADGVSIEMLDAADWRVLFTMQGHTQSQGENSVGVAGLSFGPDGQLLASAGHDDRTVRLWDAASGQLVHTLQRDQAVEAVAFSPDGKLLATLETAVDASGESITSPDSGFRFWGVR
jgi:WD40 repeat protein